MRHDPRTLICAAAMCSAGPFHTSAMPVTGWPRSRPAYLPASLTQSPGAHAGDVATAPCATVCTPPLTPPPACHTRLLAAPGPSLSLRAGPETRAVRRAGAPQYGSSCRGTACHANQRPQTHPRKRTCPPTVFTETVLKAGASAVVAEQAGCQVC